MKKNTIFMCLSLGLAGILAACTSERSIDELHPDSQASKKGKLTLSLNAGSNFERQTRFVNEADYQKTSNYKVEIYGNSSTSPIFECLGSELETKLPQELPEGNYNVKAYYGEEFDASQDAFYMVGTEPFTISATVPANVTVNCAPTCGKLSVSFDNEMSTYFDDYNVEFGGTEALGTKKIPWSKQETHPWYVKIKTSGETISYAVSVKVKDQYAYVDDKGYKQTTGTASGTLQLQRNKAYELTVSPNYTPGEKYGVSLEIEVYDKTNDKPMTIPVPVEWI